MATRMKQRRGTAAEWASQNPVLDDGEIGFETDTKVIKIGDGVSVWDALETAHLDKTGGSMTGALVLVAPESDNEAARKTDVDVVATAFSDADEILTTAISDHEALNAPHNATALATPSRIMVRDAEGRAQVVSPAVSSDVANRGYVDTENVFHHQDLRFVRSNKDSEGLFTTIQWYRTDTTLHMDSVLSGGITPGYTTRTVREYDVDGTTVLSTATYTLSYDDDGDITQEVFV
jgi:hypothetical protein